jgi:hypothetical protein
MLLNFQGCDKETGTIGLDLKERDDLLKATFTDSITLNAYSVLEDTLNTRNLQSNFLGFIKDPVFGTTSTGIFTQFIPTGNSVNFGNSPQLDSVVLTLRYAGSFYGDTLNPFAIQVYRLTEDISSSKPYYQNYKFAYSSENLTYNYDYRLYPKPKSKVKLDTIVEAHARIRLSDELGDLLLRSTSQMSSNETFKDFFKGLYICASPLANNGSLVNFNLTSALTGIQLYYKNDTVARQFQFLIKSTETVRVSHYEHDYEIGNQNFVNQVVHKDTLLGKEILYVQCMSGVQTKITFPHIKAFKDKKVVINKAELVITNIGEDLNLFPQPSNLNIYRKDRDGTPQTLPDMGTTYWGGNYNETTKEYRFRITRYIQDVIIKEDYEPTIYLVVNRRASDANRLILNGTNPADPAKRLRLEVYYTEY